MNKIAEIFYNPTIDIKRLNALQAQADPASRYVIAMTPRSGSTYLCDLMSSISRFGQPNELLNQDGLAKHIKDAPGVRLTNISVTSCATAKRITVCPA